MKDSFAHDSITIARIGKVKLIRYSKPMKSNNKAGTVELFLVFFRMGAVTFGGGYAMLPILQRELAENRGWITEEELLDIYAIGQSTPGIIAVNTATFTGYRTGGIKGALAATAGFVTPSLFIIMIIAAFLTSFHENIYVRKALKGINISVAVLLSTAVFKFGKKAILDRSGLIIALAAFSLVSFAGVSPIPVIAGSILLGVITGTIRKRGRS